MSKIKPIHPTKHTVAVSGETWDKIKACLIELYKREQEEQAPKATSWIKRILEIAHSNEDFKVSLKAASHAEVQRLKVQIAGDQALLNSFKESLHLWPILEDLTQRQQHYSPTFEEGLLLFIPQNEQFTTEQVKAFPVTSEGILAAIDWLKAEGGGNQ